MFSKIFKLFLTVVLMPLIPMALLLAYYQSRQRDNMLEIHYNLAEIVSSDIQRFSDGLQRKLSEISSVARPEDLRSVLEGLLAVNPNVPLLALLNPQGEEIFRAGMAGKPIALSAEALPKSVKEGENLKWGFPVPFSEGTAGEFIYPLPSGYFLYGAADLSALQDRLGQMRVGRTGQVFLVSPDGVFYAAPYQWTPQVAAKDMRELFAGNTRLIRALPGEEGTLAGAFAKAEPLGVYVVVLQMKEEAMRNLYFTNVIIGLFLLAIAMLAYFGALSFSRSLGEPIEELMDGARRASRGDLDHRVNEEVGWGEFKELMASFNKMTADLKDYQTLQLKARVSEMKEQIFRSVAHDLRAPLLGLQGYIYILSSGKINAQQRAEYLQRMTEAAKDLSSLLEDVLAVSRVEAGMAPPQRRAVELKPLLQSVLHTAEPSAAEKGLRLELDVSEEAEALADPKLLRRIVSNLISNAVKFTQKGFVKVSACEEKTRTLVSVADSGPGLTEKQSEEIFEKYRQADDQAQGYGLGLFISRQLARAHGGELSVSSRPGQGSVFTLALPKENV